MACWGIQLQEVRGQPHNDVTSPVHDARQSWSVRVTAVAYDDFSSLNGQPPEGFAAFHSGHLDRTNRLPFQIQADVQPPVSTFAAGFADNRCIHEAYVGKARWNGKPPLLQAANDEVSKPVSSTP